MQLLSTSSVRTLNKSPWLCRSTFSISHVFIENTPIRFRGRPSIVWHRDASFLKHIQLLCLPNGKHCMKSARSTSRKCYCGRSQQPSINTSPGGGTIITGIKLRFEEIRLQGFLPAEMHWKLVNHHIIITNIIVDQIIGGIICSVSLPHQDIILRKSGC